MEKFLILIDFNVTNQFVLLADRKKKNIQDWKKNQKTKHQSKHLSPGINSFCSSLLCNLYTNALQIWAYMQHIHNKTYKLLSVQTASV